MIKAVVFDCFGVLIADDLRMRINAVERVNPAGGQMLHDILRATDRGLLSRQESTSQMAEIMGVDADNLEASIDASLVKNTPLIDFIRTLKPTLKIGLLSNVRGKERLEELFTPEELSLFDAVVASGDVGMIKPERGVYELTLSHLGVSPVESVMIDDIKEYCDGAESAGMRAIQFKDTEQAKEDLRALIDSAK